MPETLIDIDALRQHMPRRLREGRMLVVAADSQGLALPDAVAVTDPASLLDDPPGERIPLVLLLDVLGQLDMATGRQLLGGLRDRWAEEVLILHRERDDGWDLNTFLALGFRREPAAAAGAPGHAVYRTSLYDYKLTPDWLNPRFWANPEMWGKARW